MRILFTCFVVLTALSPAAHGAAADAADAVRVYGRISGEMPLNAVKWKGGFWQDRLRRLRDVYLPGTLDGSFLDPANGSSLRNLLRAAGLEKGGAVGRSWSDGDCYLLLDVACRLYAYEPDEYPKGRLDYWIPIVAKIQREDGLVDSWSILKDFDAGSAKTWERFERQSGNRGHLAGGHQYNLGHLYKAAVSHHRATGETALLEIADRYLLHYLARAEQGGAASRTYGLTPQVAYACSLRYARTGEARFLNAMRRGYGTQPTVFGPPLRDAEQIYGHNTQSAHTLIGGAAVYGFTGETALLNALHRLTDNLLSAKVFITGAVAPVHVGDRPEQTVRGKKYEPARMYEAVGAPFDLPNETAYCESCGQCLFAEFLYRMFLLTGEAKYMDAVERSMVNAVPGCVDLEKPNFFYANPQEQGPDSKRRHATEPETGWNLAHYTWRRTYTKNCACCPPKVLRALALANEMAYSVSGDGLWVNLYGDNAVKVTLPGAGPFECRQTSGYPWDGSVRLEIEKTESKEPFSILLRIPGWVDGAARIVVNGKVQEGQKTSGTYHRIERQWKTGDTVELELPMSVRLMAAHPRVADDRGKVAVLRGPVVYCLEGDDVPEEVALDRVCVPAAADLKPVFSNELGGLIKLTGSLVCAAGTTASADRLIDDEMETSLYREARFANRERTLAEGDRHVTVSMIPYFARLNRTSDHFKIWLPVY
jgi:DUF1680 family protein